MALTSSGTISMSDIRTELGDSGAISLKEASDGTIATINTANDADDRPNGSAPHAMSEFYSYDHSASSPSTAFNAPSNFSITSSSMKRTIDLCPIEEFTEHKKLKMIKKINYNFYKPSLTKKIRDYDINFKPGFYNQYREFKKFSKRNNKIINDIVFARNVLRLTKKLVD